MSTLKQGTLSFASSKRTNARNEKSKNGTPVTEKRKNTRVHVQEHAQSVAKSGETLEVPSDADGAAAIEIRVPAKRTRASTKAQVQSGPTKQISPQQSPSVKDESLPEVKERDRLDVEDKAHRYLKYYNEVRSKMGYIEPVHSESQNKIHQMLRFFDMSYEFGPCIGMTRLERWERAEAFGLNPPVEVREILLTKEGAEKAEYAQCVLHGEV